MAEDQRSKKEPWIGIPIAHTLGVDLEKPAIKKAIVALIRRWLDGGVLIVVGGVDDQPHTRAFVLRAAT